MQSMVGVEILIGLASKHAMQRLLCSFGNPYSRPIRSLYLSIQKVSFIILIHTNLASF